MDLDSKKRIDYVLGSLLIGLLKVPTMLLGRAMKRDHRPVLEREACLIKMQGGGSLVIAFPSLLGLKRRYPGCRLRLVCTPAVKPFADLLGLFDEIITIDDRSLLRLVWSGCSALARVWRVDTIIDLEAYSRLTTAFSLFTCARNRVGFYLDSIFWRKNISSHLIYFNQFSGVFHFYDGIARLFDSEPINQGECRDHLLKSLHAGRHGERPVISIGHACSELGRERMLNGEEWAKVLSNLRESSDLYFLGGVSDRGDAESIITYCSIILKGHRFHNLCGELSLRDSVSFIAGSDAFFGIDSGLLHFARMLGIRSTSIWGPTDPASRLRPIQGLEEKIYYCKQYCSPCIHVTETPPCHGDNVCIKALFTPMPSSGPRLSILEMIASNNPPSSPPPDGPESTGLPLP